MIVVRSDALGGLDSAMLRPMLGLREDELIITIRIEDGPPVPQQPPADAAPRLPPEAISLPVIADATDHDTDAPDDADDQPGRALRQRLAPSSDADTRGLTFHQLEQQAKAKRMELVSPGQGVYTLISAFGQRHYASLQQVADALRYGRFD